MPTIRTPDGRRLRVPDNATPEQINAVLQSIGAAPKADFSDVESRVDASGPERTTGQKIKHDLGLSTRNVVEGTADLVGLFVDPFIHAANWLGEKGPTTKSLITGVPERRWERQATTREGWGQLLDKAGVPRPETASERVQSDAGRALTGVGLTLGLGSALNGLPRLQQFLTAAPKTQIAGAATGAGAAGVAREAGLPVPVQVGAGIAGGLSPAAGSSLLSLANGAGRQVIRSTVSPFTGKGVDQAVGTVLRGSALHPERLSVPGPSAIPGVSRTLAEETLDPGIAQLQRAVSARRGAEFDQMRRANNVARSEAIGGIAGDRAAMEAAERARATTANPLRTEAMKIDGVDTSRLLSQIKRLENAQTGRPAVQKALTDVRSLLTREVGEAERKKDALSALAGFAENGRKSAADLAAAKAAMTMIRRGEMPSGAFTSKTGQEALKSAQKAFARETVGHDRVAVLDNVRKTIGDMLGGKYGGDSAAALAGSRELMAVKNQLDRVLAKQAPKYGEYIEAYKQGSKPINRMQLGESLLDSGTGATLDPVTGAYQIQPGAFGRQVKDLDRVAQKATGFNKAKASDILSQKDFATIGAVNDDLSRQVFADTAARGSGSDSFQKFMTQGDILGAVQELGFSVPGSGLLRMLGKAGTDRVNARLAEALTNPGEARRILEQATPVERRVIEEALQRLQAAPGSVTSAYTSSKEN